MTVCILTYLGAVGGQLKPQWKRIADAKTGAQVNRGFYDADEKHWMEPSELPTPPKSTATKRGIGFRHLGW